MEHLISWLTLAEPDACDWRAFVDGVVYPQLDWGCRRFAIQPTGDGTGVTPLATFASWSASSSSAASAPLRGLGGLAAAFRPLVERGVEVIACPGPLRRDGRIAGRVPRRRPVPVAHARPGRAAPVPRRGHGPGPARCGLRRRRRRGPPPCP